MQEPDSGARSQIQEQGAELWTPTTRIEEFDTNTNASDPYYDLEN